MAPTFYFLVDDLEVKVILSEDDYRHALEFDTPEGRAQWRLTQSLVARGVEFTHTAYVGKNY